jgi:hypothetical protein
MALIDSATIYLQRIMQSTLSGNQSPYNQSLLSQRACIIGGVDFKKNFISKL